MKIALKRHLSKRRGEGLNIHARRMKEPKKPPVTPAPICAALVYPMASVAAVMICPLPIPRGTHSGNCLLTAVLVAPPGCFTRSSDHPLQEPYP